MIFLCRLYAFLSLSSFNLIAVNRVKVYISHIKKTVRCLRSKNFPFPHISPKPKKHALDHTHTGKFLPMFLFRCPFCQLFQNLFPWQSGIDRNHIVAEETGMKLKTCKPCDGLSDMRWTRFLRVDVAEVWGVEKNIHHGNLRSIFTWDLYLIIFPMKYSIASCH